MDIRPIRNDDDHTAALQEIERLWGAAPGTPEGDRLDVLVTLVDAYENERWPIEAGDPVDALTYAIEEMGRSQVELAKVLGSRSRASEVLKRKRALTVEMIRAVNEAWGIPTEVLVRPYRTSEAA